MHLRSTSLLVNAGFVLSATLSPPTSVPPTASQEIAKDFVSLGVAVHFFHDYATNVVNNDTVKPNEFSMNLLSELGKASGTPPTLRVGGTSGDNSVVVPNSEQPSKTLVIPKPKEPFVSQTVTINHRWFTEVFHDKYPTGTQFIYDAQLAKDKLDNSMLGANLAVKAIGKDRLAGMEVGNEPDLYVGQNLRKKSYDEQKYVTNWRNFSEAIFNKVLKPAGISRKVFQGGAVSSRIGRDGDWTAQSLFQSGLNKDLDSIKTFSRHHYQVRHTTSATFINPYMNHTAIAQGLDVFTDDIKFLSGKGVGLVGGENNMAIAVGHQDSVSIIPSFAGALWFVDYLLHAATIDFTRVFLQQGTSMQGAAWVPIEFKGAKPHVRPHFGALMMVTETIGSPNSPVRIAPLKIDTEKDGNSSRHRALSAYAIYESKKLTRLAVINFNFWSKAGINPNGAGSDSTNASASKGRVNTNFTISLPDGISSVSVKTLTNEDGAASKTSATFGGLQWTFASNGKPVKKDGVPGVQRFSANKPGGKVTVPVGASEAALITLNQ